MDLEIPARDPRTFSDITRHGHHILKLETVLMTIYYPSTLGSGVDKDPSGNRKWSRQTWLPRPRTRTAQGYGKFAGMGDLAVPFFAATTMFTKIPAFRNSRPATHWPPSGSYRGRHGNEKVKNTEGPPPEGKGPEPKFPLMFFSHGLGGTRTAYSSLCGEVGLDITMCQRGGTNET
jgi:platelet-activating factor acetylhydrolase